MAARDELQTSTEAWLNAFNKGDPAPFLNALDEDLEVIDTVPYRFDSKASFVDFLQAGMAGLEAGSFFFRPPSYRVVNDNTGLGDAYYVFTMVAQAGGGAADLVWR